MRRAIRTSLCPTFKLRTFLVAPQIGSFKPVREEVPLFKWPNLQRCFLNNVVLTFILAGKLGLSSGSDGRRWRWRRWGRDVVGSIRRLRQPFLLSTQLRWRRRWLWRFEESCGFVEIKSNLLIWVKNQEDNDIKLKVNWTLFRAKWPHEEGEGAVAECSKALHLIDKANGN